MGIFSEYDATLQEVSRAMSDQPPDIQLEYRVDAMAREWLDLPLKNRFDCLIKLMDELMVMAREGELNDQQIAVGQVMSRAQLIASFLLARSQPTGLRVIRNG